LFLKRGGFGFRNFHQAQITLRDLEQNQVAKVAEQIGKQAAQVFSLLREIVS